MEGEGKVSNDRRPMEGEREVSFSPFSTSPQTTYLGFCPFPLTSRFCFTIVLGRYLHIPYFCPWPINYAAPFNVTSPHTFVVDSVWLKIPSFLLELMASRMTMFYGPQAAQMNEELALESSLDLTLTQHPRDEDPASREVRACLAVDPPQA